MTHEIDKFWRKQQPMKCTEALKLPVASVSQRRDDQT